jgi:signal transduction histidine kinase
MLDPMVNKARVIEAIEDANANLDDAIQELDRLPAVDVSTNGLVAHALSSYLTVTDATLGLLMQALDEHPNPDVATWLAGLRHAGVLMQHTAGRLLNGTPSDDFPLKPEYVDVAVLMQRACDYYGRTDAAKPLEMVCRSLGEVPPAWADRVALAAVADRLLSNAVAVSTPGGTILVQCFAGPGGVVCSVLDSGPSLTPLEQSQLFDPDAIAGLASEHTRAARFALVLAKHLVGRMNGRLWSDAEPGKGTCISFRLPYHSEGFDRR